MTTPEEQASGAHTVPVKYLDSDVPGVDTSGGITTEMCPECFALAPTEKIRDHIDSHLPPERPPGHPDQQPPPEQPEVTPLPS